MGFIVFTNMVLLISWGKEKIEGDGDHEISKNGILSVLEHTLHISQTNVGKLSECDFGKREWHSPSFVMQMFQNSLSCLRP